MSAFTDYTAEKVRNHVLGAQAWTMPTTLKVALYTSSTGIKTNSPSGEVSDANYARQTITFDTSGVSSAVSFLGPTVGMTITHAGIVDNTANKILWAAPLATPKTLVAGEPMFFPAGSISLSISTIS